ncbi:MAG: imidazole glycerol phosphate synthase subunit HisH [Schwartzia sp.]|nr:imidazole glycerol phosphate synthase subunit HisH [Schwartzia sp. (in: firmicutes)]
MIAIMDYGVGNLFSVEKAFLYLGADAMITNDAEVLRQADKIVLPGVGAFGDCMKNLQASGMIPVLKERVQAGVPLLGICVGLQILFEGSDESPEAEGLGFFRGRVRKIRADGLKIPHMGWNSIEAKQRTQMDLFAGLPENPFVYFVHSYHAVPEDAGIVTATADYGERLTAAVAKGNICAAQFHPEKSGDVGLKIIKNFVDGGDAA